ncbi:hypothetical protein HK098_003188 [Nowakowskiella sp. JEL0407]|nr:hypothetical protein HK098_003188 [Nowakowskiella sp. JEL0407]
MDYEFSQINPISTLEEYTTHRKNLQSNVDFLNTNNSNELDSDGGVSWPQVQEYEESDGVDIEAVIVEKMTGWRSSFAGRSNKYKHDLNVITDPAGIPINIRQLEELSEKIGQITEKLRLGTGRNSGYPQSSRDEFESSEKISLKTFITEVPWIKEKKKIEREAPQTDMDKMVEIPSSVYGPGPQIQRIWFDVYSTSPLITRYIQLYGFGTNTRKTLTIHRSEIVRSTTPSLKYKCESKINNTTVPTRKLSVINTAIDQSLVQGNITYRDIINKSQKNSKIIHKQYLKSTEDYIRDKNAIQVGLSNEINVQKKQVAKVLSKPAVVKELANKIIADGKGLKL